jgi:hypothetical protein
VLCTVMYYKTELVIYKQYIRCNTLAYAMLFIDQTANKRKFMLYANTLHVMQASTTYEHAYSYTYFYIREGTFHHTLRDTKREI